MGLALQDLVPARLVVDLARARSRGSDISLGAPAPRVDARAWARNCHRQEQNSPLAIRLADENDQRRQPLTPPPTRLMAGVEPITGTDATLSDFRSWAMSDLRSNTTRPMLAEFIVARALGAAARPRTEWHPYDVETADGLKIEVKSAAYLQSWPQRTASKISFGGLRAGILDPVTNRTSAQSYNADVYVFAIIGALEHDAYDALDTGAWEFWVASRAVIAATTQRSLTLKRVQELAAGPFSYAGLAEAVRTAAAVESTRRCW